MDMLEKMFREARDDRIHEYPLLSHGEPPRVLDLGCGTGLWCMEMAEYELPASCLVCMLTFHVVKNLRTR